MKNISRKEQDKIKKFYNSYGWVKISNFLSKQEIKTIKKKIEAFLKNTQKKYNGRDINFVESKKSKEINSFHRMHDIKWVKKFSNRKDVKDFIKIFLNSTPELRASELFAKPKKVGLPAPIHQDNFYWKVKNNNALTIWIALGSSDSKNGGIFYYNGSHKSGIFKHVPSYAKGSSQKIGNTEALKKFKRSTPKLKSGDALVHHVLVAHGSNKNISNRTRRGWTLQYKDKKSSYDKLAIRAYEKSLKKQLITRNKD